MLSPEGLPVAETARQLSAAVVVYLDHQLAQLELQGCHRPWVRSHPVHLCRREASTRQGPFALSRIDGSYLSDLSNIFGFIMQFLDHTIEPRSYLRRVRFRIHMRANNAYLCDCFIRLDFTYLVELLNTGVRFHEPLDDLYFFDTYESKPKCHILTKFSLYLRLCLIE